MKNKTTKTTTSLELPELSPQELQEANELEKKETKTVLFLVFSAFLLTLISGTVIYNILNNSISQDESGRDSNVLGEIGKEDTFNQYEPVRKVAYISGGNIWIYDFYDGRNIQMTSDGGKNGEYKTLAWKNKKELTFSKCDAKSCSISTYDYYERTIIENFIVDAQDILSLRWSHRGDKFAYLSKDGEELKLSLKIGDKNRDLTEFEYVDRVFDVNDSVSVRFSPNDENIMIVNTLTSLTQPRIKIVNLEGKGLLSLLEDEITFGFFMSNDTIYYKKGDYVYVRSIEKGNEVQLTEHVVGAFSFQPSPDKTKIAYWTQDWNSGISTVWTYDISSDKINRLKDQCSYPAWVEDDMLICINLADCRQCGREKFEFLGITSIDLRTKVAKELVKLEDVEEFAVENY